jgi:hypothetical protein
MDTPNSPRSPDAPQKASDNSGWCSRMGLARPVGRPLDGAAPDLSGKTHSAPCSRAARGWYPLVSHSPHSSGERATASGAVSAGSNPAGGATYYQPKCGPELVKRKRGQRQALTVDAAASHRLPGSAPHTRPKEDANRQPSNGHFCASWSSGPSSRGPPSRGAPSRCKVSSMRLIQAGHALGVDAHQHVNAVARPRCHLSGRDTGIETPGDTGMAQVVGTSK